MQKFLLIIRAALGITATTAIILLSVLLWHADRAARGATDLLANANIAMVHFSNASLALEGASKQQQTYLDHTSAELDKAVVDAKALIVRTDLSLNGDRLHPGLLPRLAGDLDQQSAAALATQAQLRASLKSVSDLSASMETGIQNVNLATSNLAKLSADPEIPAAMHDLADSSRKLDAGITDMAAVTADAHKAADYYLAEIQKPVKKIKLIGEELVRLAGKFLGY